MNPPRAADDFATIRVRMEELRREREAPQAPRSDVPRDLPLHSGRYGSRREISAAPKTSPTISRDTRLGREELS